MKKDLVETFIQHARYHSFSDELFDLIELVKSGYLKVDERYEKKWEKLKVKTSFRSDDDNYIKFEVTEKGRKYLQKIERTDYDKGHRQLTVKPKASDQVVRPKELFIGDVVTGRFEEVESSRTGNFDGDDDFEYSRSNFRSGPDVRYDLSEDYVTRITPGEVKTGQVIWTSDRSGGSFTYGLVDLSDGKVMYSSPLLSELLDYVDGAFWDWRVMQEGESLTVKVGERNVKSG